jgi:hypothetical protein
MDVKKIKQGIKMNTLFVTHFYKNKKLVTCQKSVTLISLKNDSYLLNKIKLYFAL